MLLDSNIIKWYYSILCMDEFVQCSLQLKADKFMMAL